MDDPTEDMAQLCGAFTETSEKPQYTVQTEPCPERDLTKNPTKISRVNTNPRDYPERIPPPIGLIKKIREFACLKPPCCLPRPGHNIFLNTAIGRFPQREQLPIHIRRGRYQTLLATVGQSVLKHESGTTFKNPATP
ncbi:hypothetical protein JTB14_038074 [Gonioctena quinquepunctata]|nr:hypothetical protein JTB14_038074 [Gonioctena quinquepunctata]